MQLKRQPHPLRNLHCRVYVYHEGLCRLALNRYSKNPKDLKKKGVHVTNFSINSKLAADAPPPPPPPAVPPRSAPAGKTPESGVTGQNRGESPVSEESAATAATEPTSGRVSDTTEVVTGSRGRSARRCQSEAFRPMRGIGEDEEDDEDEDEDEGEDAEAGEGEEEGGEEEEDGKGEEGVATDRGPGRGTGEAEERPRGGGDLKWSLVSGVLVTIDLSL